MRALRMSLAGALVLTMLAGSGSGLLAQTTDESSGDPARPTYFTAETEWTQTGSGKFAHRIWWFEGPTLASDDRLTGESGVMFRSDDSGELHIRNDGGDWYGPLGMAPQAGRYGAWLVGDGAYDGMTAFIHGTVERPITEEGDLTLAEWVSGPVTSTIEGWVFSEPTSEPAWMEDHRILLFLFEQEPTAE